MDTIAASVIGARHLRIARNGQDAAAAASGPGWAVAAVCDGCSAGAYSEVGARLGAMLVVASLARRFGAGEAGLADAGDAGLEGRREAEPPAAAAMRDLWAEVQAEVVAAL